MFDALRGYISAYVKFSDNEFKAFTQLLEIRSYDKKAQLTKIGETEKHLNFVVKGLARKYFIKGKEEIVTHIAKENAIISSTTSFELEMPSNFIVETIEPSTFISITKENLELICKQSHKIEHLRRLVITALFVQKELMEYERMRLSTRERFVQYVHTNSDLLQRVPQKYLASYLNIKPETFSRLKHLLQAKK